MFHTYGIMQGRLSPPEDGRFQSFPCKTWREEIPRAREAGLDYIEWIHDEYGHNTNPIFSDAGLSELASLKQVHNIATPALCGDWFMEHPFVRCTPEQLADRERYLHEIIPIAARIGADRIVLPFVDQSKIATEYEKQTVIEILQRAIPPAEFAKRYRGFSWASLDEIRQYLS